MSLITWSPTDKSSAITLANNNLTVDSTLNARFRGARATEGKEIGKWYWEIIINSSHYSVYSGIGVALINAEVETSATDGTAGSIATYRKSGNKSKGGTASGSVYGTEWTVNDVIGVGLDLENKTIEFYKNGVSQGVAFNDLFGLSKYYPFISCYNTLNATANFGSTPFKYEVPEGYLPYDIDNASWFTPNKYLFKCNNDILKPTMNGLELVEGTLNTQLFEEHGTEYLPDIVGQYDKEVDMIYKENLEGKKLYGYKLVGYRNIDKLEVK